MIPAGGELVLSLGMAIAAGLVGCFAVMRKMTLASDAISHVALPGIGIALLLHVQPLLGGMAMLILGTLLIWAVESKTRIATETVVGVVFSAALALGALVTEEEALVEALFGKPGTLPAWELVFGVVGAIGVAVVILSQRHRLIIALVSRDLAHTAGVGVSRLNLLYLISFAITVGLGLRYLGVAADGIAHHYPRRHRQAPGHEPQHHAGHGGRAGDRRDAGRHVAGPRPAAGNRAVHHRVAAGCSSSLSSSAGPDRLARPRRLRITW